jgi:hypothetical protein
MKGKTAKVVGPLVVLVAIVVIVVVVVVTSGGGAKKQQRSGGEWTWEVRPVTERQIRQLPPASEPIQVTNRLGKPLRTEEAQLGTEVPQQRYFYYPVAGAEGSRVWELAFEDQRLSGSERCSVAKVRERGGGACSQPPRR